MRAHSMVIQSGGHHLPANVQYLLDHPNDVRVRAIRAGSWIPYPRAEEIRELLWYALRQPSTHRMTGFTLFGPTGNGKTTIVNAFMREVLTPVADPNAERTPLLYVETPPVPNLSMFLSSILQKVQDPRANYGTVVVKMNRVRALLPELRPRMIFIDEIHNILSGSSKNQEVVLNAIKYLSNELRIPMVLIGTDEAKSTIRSDPQVASRFPAVELPRWPADESFERLIGEILGTYPLRRPYEISAASVRRLYTQSQGALGGLMGILERAAVLAIEHGTEAVDAALINHAASQMANRAA